MKRPNDTFSNLSLIHCNNTDNERPIDGQLVSNFTAPQQISLAIDDTILLSDNNNVNIKPELRISIESFEGLRMLNQSNPEPIVE
jgi:hypothetical protein